ncbi:MAG: hypothetical protein WA021_00070, partial [Minisyncoccia bacterium]
MYSTKQARDSIRGKRVRSIRWQNNASPDIIGATGLWPSLAGLDGGLYQAIDKLIWDIWHDHKSGINLHHGRYAVTFGKRLIEIQEKLDKAAAAVDSDAAEVSLTFKTRCMGHGTAQEPEITITTVTSGTKFTFGTSHSMIDFGEDGSTQRALESLHGLSKT